MSHEKILNNPWNIVGLCLGIIGVLMATNSYVSQIKEEKFAILAAKQELQLQMQEQVHQFEKSKVELERLSKKAYKEFEKDQRLLVSKILILEKYMEEREKVNVYYHEVNTEDSIYMSDVEIVNRIKNAQKGTDKLFVLESIWHENNYIAKQSQKAFLRLFTIEDMYVFIKRLTREDVDYYIGQTEMVTDWFDSFESNGLFEFEMALTKVVVNYPVDDSSLSYFMKDVLRESPKSKELKAILRRLIDLFEHYELVRSLNTAREFYLSVDDNTK